MSNVRLYDSVMDVVIDTSAVIAVITNEPEEATVSRHIDGATLFAPVSLHWEIGNAFSSMFRRGSISLNQATDAISRYEQMPLRLMNVDLRQSLELSHRLNLYAYDAYVIACAGNLSVPLLTLDRRMAAVAPSVGVQMVELAP